MRSTMRFGRLPFDLLQSIADYLRLEDYTGLFATFDRSLQKTLSAPGFFRQLSIDADLRTLSWDVHYLLRAAREMGHLIIKDDVSFAPHELPLILSLNPLELTLPSILLLKYSTTLLEKYVNDKADKKERHLARFMTVVQLPKFSRLTPRLERLTLSHSLQALPNVLHRMLWDQETSEKPHHDRSSFLRFPDSLVAISSTCVPERVFPFLIEALPNTLRSLELTYISHEQDVASLIAPFPQLENLHLHRFDGDFRWDSGAATVSSFPKSLVRLGLSATSAAKLTRFCNDSRIQSSQISIIELNLAMQPYGAASDSELDLRRLLPTSVTEATVTIANARFQDKNDGFTITSLPHSLTALTLQLSSNCEPLFKAIMKLPQLKSLNLKRKRAPACVYYIAHLEPTASEPPIVDKPSKAAAAASDAVADSSDYETGTESDSSSVDSSVSFEGPTISNNKRKNQQCITFALLPRSLTHLRIEHCRTTSIGSMASDLPTGLIYLSLPMIDLSDLPLLKDHLPRCFFDISAPINVWKSSAGSVLLHRDFGWRGHVDLQEWAMAVSRHFSTLNVRFTLDWEHDGTSESFKTSKRVKSFEMKSTTPATIGLISLGLDSWYSYEPILCSCYNMQKLVLNRPPTSTKTRSLSLSSFPHSLTHFESDDPALSILLSFTSREFVIPHSLTYISTKSYGNLRRVLPKNLTFLDAPSWKMDSALLSWNFDKFEKLSVSVSNILDARIVSFLSSEQVVRNRSKLAFNFFYFTSGLLLPSSGPNAVQDVTWNLMKSTTQQMLQVALSQPWPSSPASSSETSKSKANQTIGSIVGSVTPESAYTDQLTLYLPPSTTTATIKLGDPGDCLIAATTSKAKQRNLPPDDPVHSFKFPQKIVRLELLGVHLPNGWLATLPSTVTHLDVCLNDDFNVLGGDFPPKLKVLILTAGRQCNLPFQLSQLPSSLKHLLIAANAFGLHLSEDAFKESTLNLPRLESVRLLYPTLVTAYVFCKRLPLKNINFFNIVAETIDNHTTNELQHRLSGKLTGSHIYSAIRSTSKLIWSTNSSYGPVSSLVALERHEIKKALSK